MNNSDLLRLTQEALASFVNRKPAAPPWAGRKIVIYGAGGFGRDLAKALLLQGDITLLGFIDQKGTGQAVLNGLPAHPLDSATGKRWLAEQPVVVIGIHNHLTGVREIKERLAQAGFSNIVTPMEAYPHLSKELGSRYWLGTPQDYAAAAGPIAQAGALWADEESRRVFFETLLFRLDVHLDAVTPPMDIAFQYAVPELPRWPEPLRMVDGGAYTGDTLQSMLQQRYQFDAIYAFEPDEENFKKLGATAAAMKGEAKISLWPCGLWSSTRRMNFSQGDGAASSLSEAGPSMVPVVALDDVLRGQPVNLIKMDIEGAEVDALLGARQTIKKYRPGLAVCLYHYPHHLWSIPLWVQDLNLNYRLYCRTHHQNTYDTVLYAVPA